MTNTTYSPGEQALPLKQHTHLTFKLALFWSEKSVEGGKLNSTEANDSVMKAAGK